MNIPTDDSLKKLQQYIWQMNIDRGFNLEDPSKKLVMLMEEVGELAKAVRKLEISIPVLTSWMMPYQYRMMLYMLH
jgi:NTP pyrophosphatase (non-canonical NTP hydrolase)